VYTKESLLEERRKNKKQLLIAKEDFVYSLNTIVESQKKYKTFDAALKEVCDGYPILTIGNEVLVALITLLEKACGDESETVSWWLFESVEKRIWINPGTALNPTSEEIEIDVSTPEKLYEYFQMW
jgi:hypothetical protein